MQMQKIKIWQAKMNSYWQRPLKQDDKKINKKLKYLK